MSESKDKEPKLRLRAIASIVQIDLQCGSDYEACVLLEDIVARLQAGESIELFVPPLRKDGR